MSSAGIRNPKTQFKINVILTFWTLIVAVLGSFMLTKSAGKRYVWPHSPAASSPSTHSRVSQPHTVPRVTTLEYKVRFARSSSIKRCVPGVSLL